ncbi:MAG: PEP-CTERM sorting domain-containing protein [Phycisphaeraceae bacterium]
MFVTAALSSASLASAGVIAANFDPETVDVNAMSYIRPTNSYFIGAHEDSLGTSTTKPIWTTTIFFSPDMDETMGRVSIALRARQQRDVRLELLDTNGSFDPNAFLAPDAANTFTFLGKAVIPAAEVTTGHTILDFDFDPIPLDDQRVYALKLTMDAVGGPWSAGSFDWLGVLGDAVPFLLDSAHHVPANSVVPDGTYGAPSFGVYSFGTLSKGSFNIGPSFSVETPVPEPASVALIALGATLIARRSN